MNACTLPTTHQHHHEVTQSDADCIGSLLRQRPLWAWFSLSWTMDLGVGKPTHHDGKLIKTSHATQDGRRKNAKCRPSRSGDSSKRGAGSTKRCLGVQSARQKNVASEPENEP